MDAIYNENIISSPDAANWSTSGCSVNDFDDKIEIKPLATSNTATRNLTGFDTSYNNLTFHATIYVKNDGILPVHTIEINIPGVGNTSFVVEDLSPGEERMVYLNHSFDVTLTSTNFDVEITQTYVSGSANAFIKIEKIGLKQVVIEPKTRSYFVLGDVFEQSLTKKTGRINVSSIRIDGVEQLTNEYQEDQLSLPGSFPLNEWGFSNCNINSTTCGIEQPFPGYNPFFDESLVDFNVVPDGEKRGRAINSRNNKNYGTALFNFGIDKQSVFDANGDQRNGAFFIDIDFTKDFSCVINVFLSDRSNAYVKSVFNRSFVIAWDSNSCIWKFNEVNLLTIPVTETSIIDLGFLKGSLTQGEKTYQLEDVCNVPKPDCEYKERTLGFATFVRLPQEAPEDKGFKECCVENYVLAHQTDDDDYKNDYSGFWHKKQLDSETVNFRITGSGGFDETITDDTFGEYITNHLTQPGLITFVLDWRKVLIANGSGHYEVEKEVIIAGITKTIPLGGYNLKDFTNTSADKTVRVDAIMNGLFVELDVDFSGVNFRSSTRVRGFFGRRDPSFVEDNLINANYRSNQISIKQENEYKFQTNNIPSCLTEEILDFLLMGNEVFMNDYNLINHSYKYKKFSVVVSGNDGTEYTNQGRSAVLNLTFAKRVVDRIKRNY